MSFQVRVTDQERALLDDGQSNFTHVDKDKTSLQSSVFNLTNTILGAGLLAVPWTFKKCGVIPTIVLFVLATFASRLGLILLVKCSQTLRTQLRQPQEDDSVNSDHEGFSDDADPHGGEPPPGPGRPGDRQEEPSFALAAKRTFPLLRYYTDIVVGFKCFGVATAYLIVVGDLMPEVFDDFSNSNSAEDGEGADIDHSEDWYEGRRFWISVAILILSPICTFLQKLDSLKWTSVLALSTVCYLTVMVVVYYFQHYDENQDLNPDLWHVNIGIFSALPVIVFSFTCHQNIFSIYKELDKEKHKIEHVIDISTITCLCTYLVVGIFSYLTWVDDTESDILTNYPKVTEWTIAKIGIVLLVTFSYPLQAFPCRYSVHNLTCRLLKLEPGPLRRKGILWTAEMILILGVTYVVALFVDDLGVVFGVIGATGSSSVSYLLPGLFYLKLSENSSFREDWYRVGALVLTFLGIFVLVVGNTVTIMDAV